VCADLGEQLTRDDEADVLVDDGLDEGLQAVHEIVLAQLQTEHKGKRHSRHDLQSIFKPPKCFSQMDNYYILKEEQPKGFELG
jgi:hypothetical protein